MTQQSNTARPIPVVDRAKRLQIGEAGAEVKRRLARAQRLAREHAGLHQKEVAAVAGLDQPNYSRTELDHEPASLNVRHLALLSRDQLTRPFALRMLQWLDGEVDPAADVHGDRHGARLASVTAESGDVLRLLSAALADGRLDDEPDTRLEELEREANEAARAFLELVGAARRELAKRRGAR